MHADSTFVIVPSTGPFVRLVAADRWFALKAAQGHPISPEARNRLADMPCHLGAAPQNVTVAAGSLTTEQLDSAVLNVTPRINAAIARMRRMKSGGTTA